MSIKISSIIYNFLYRIIFLITSVCLALHIILPRIKYRLLGLLTFNREDCAFIQQHAFEKRPGHLSILLKDDELNFPELSKLVCWSVAAGIQTISIYDSQGILKKTEEKFSKLLKTESEQFFGTQASSYTLNLRTLSASSKLELKTNPVLNTLPKNEYQIILCSLEDGRWDIVEFTRKFCTAVKEKQCQPSDLNADLIHNNLSLGTLPEPDLILICDDAILLNGYMPWHIRLSEMKSIGSLKYLSCHSFIQAMQEFGQTEQRFGK